MDIFEITSKYFWVEVIVMTCIGASILKFRSKKYISENPSLSAGYELLFKGYLFWMNIPWIVMGVGCTLGGVPSVWYYFRPKDGNPYVLAFFGSLVVIHWIIGTIWLFFKGGAEMLVKYPGALRGEIKDPKMVKAIWLLCLAGSVVGVTMMWMTNVPIPNLR